MRVYWVGTAVCAALFAVLFAHRIGLIDRYRFESALPAASAAAVPERDTWMNIFQNNRKIGFAHAVLSREKSGLRMNQTLFMRINTMGMVHGIHLTTEGLLNPDMTLSAFRFSMSSGRFEFTADGRIENDRLLAQTHSAGETQEIQVPLGSRPYLAAGIYDAVWAADAAPGSRRVIPVFDPATMSQEPVTVEVLGTEPVTVMGQTVEAMKIAVDFKGSLQQAWLGEGGEVLRQKGFMGITLEKTDRRNALYGLPVEASRDMTEAVSIPVNVALENPNDLQRLTVSISGIDPERLQIDGGRQRLEEGRLIVEKESLEGLPDAPSPGELSRLAEPYLQPTPFIQSDHRRLTTLAKEVTRGAKTSLESVERIVDWMKENIEPRPVISMPDALATLENRTGDCNEHAVLFAALARAAGIPVEIEAGVVYLRDRFFYHAWNRVYLGRWITVDPLFGQIPADATHIRLAVGTPEQQLDLMSVIGRLELGIVAQDAAPNATTASTSES